MQIHKSPDSVNIREILPNGQGGIITNNFLPKILEEQIRFMQSLIMEQQRIIKRLSTCEENTQLTLWEE